MHRDLKPQNILVGDGLVLKIGDFGLAREFADSKDVANTACGTRLYMSPETYGGHYSLPSDVWSLGCILYELW